MTAPRKPQGGRGSNQYQSKGSSGQPATSRTTSAGLAAAANEDPEQVAVAFMDSQTRREHAATITSPEALTDLTEKALQSEDEDLLDALIANQHTPGGALEEILDNAQWSAANGEAFAQHPNLEPEHLDTHITSFIEENPTDRSGRDAPLLHGTALREDLAEDLYEFLASDLDPEVRATVAGNTKTPVVVLEALAHDSAPSVRKKVSENPSADAATLTALMKLDGKNERVMLAVAQRKDCPPAVIAELAGSPSKSVRAAAASNATCPADALTKLRQDHEPEVRRAAWWTYRTVVRPKP